MADDLAERLRALVGQIDPCMVGGRDAVLLTEAATRIEFDSKRIEELEGALRPFAREFDRMRWDESKDCLSFGDSGFCYGDLREASATLARKRRRRLSAKQARAAAKP